MPHRSSGGRECWGVGWGGAGGRRWDNFISRPRQTSLPSRSHPRRALRQAVLLADFTAEALNFWIADAAEGGRHGAGRYFTFHDQNPVSTKLRHRSVSTQWGISRARDRDGEWHFQCQGNTVSGSCSCWCLCICVDKRGVRRMRTWGAQHWPGTSEIGVGSPGRPVHVHPALWWGGGRGKAAA